jgi:4-hydroxybenzoate polyprenyltransferase
MTKVKWPREDLRRDFWWPTSFVFCSKLICSSLALITNIKDSAGDQDQQIKSSARSHVISTTCGVCMCGAHSLGYVGLVIRKT